jgi:hypothetical protein
VAWTPSTFKARWTEFAPKADALVQAALDEAARACDARIYKAQTDDAVGLLAAHNLATSPQGTTARLESDKGESVYKRRFDQITRARAGGPVLVGWRP